MTRTTDTWTRRAFLQSAAAASALALFGRFNVAFAAAPGDERFVFVILRGAMDGLAAVPAYGDGAYRDSRGALALPPDAYTAVDNMFGLHKSLQSFTAFYQSREALVLHAVATPYRERSHFDAQNVLEGGAEQAHATRDGWLNRALALYGTGQSLGLAVGQTIPLALQGAAPVGTWAPAADGLPEDTVMLALNKMYAEDLLFHAALAQAADVHDIADSALGNEDLSRGMGRNLRNRQAMTATARAVGKILADPKGPRIATIEIGGWDTHAQQGLTDGILSNNLSALDACFAGLKESMGSLWQKTVVLAATEFGRTVSVNGTGGTDHGTASAAFLAGGAVLGGRVVTQWPGLDKTRLYEGRDLMPTMDLRQVGKSILADHLRFDVGSIDRDVFPGSAGTHPLQGLIRT